MRPASFCAWLTAREPAAMAGSSPPKNYRLPTSHEFDPRRGGFRRPRRAWAITPGAEVETLGLESVLGRPAR